MAIPCIALDILDLGGQSLAFQPKFSAVVIVAMMGRKELWSD
jgi:hypothetical protein